MDNNPKALNLMIQKPLRFAVLLHIFRCFSLCFLSVYICIPAAVDPCNPNPCGAAACSVQDGVGVCHCPPGVKVEECHVGESLKLALICERIDKIAHQFNVLVLI